MIFIRADDGRVIFNINYLRRLSKIKYHNSSQVHIVWSFDDDSEFTEPWSQERWDYIVSRLP